MLLTIIGELMVEMLICWFDSIFLFTRLIVFMMESFTLRLRIEISVNPFMIRLSLLDVLYRLHDVLPDRLIFILSINRFGQFMRFNSERIDEGCIEHDLISIRYGRL